MINLADIVYVYMFVCIPHEEATPRVALLSLSQGLCDENKTASEQASLPTCSCLLTKALLLVFQELPCVGLLASCT